MASMYETIRELPLFKGIGDEQLSFMLEKTSVDFKNFVHGQSIWEPGIPARHIAFILKGFVKQIHKLENFNIFVEEISGAGGVLGAVNLFGLITEYQSWGLSYENSSLMIIDKVQYMKILLSDEIYLMNYLNYLSASAQRKGVYAIENPGMSVSEYINMLSFSLTSSQALEVRLRGEEKEFLKLLNIDKEEYLKWKTGQGIIDGFKFEEEFIIVKKSDIKI